MRRLLVRDDSRQEPTCDTNQNTTIHTAQPTRACPLVGRRPHTEKKHKASVRLRCAQLQTTAFIRCPFICVHWSEVPPRFLLALTLRHSPSLPSNLWPYPQRLLSNHSPWPRSAGCPSPVPMIVPSGQLPSLSGNGFDVPFSARSQVSMGRLSFFQTSSSWSLL